MKSLYVLYLIVYAALLAVFSGAVLGISLADVSALVSPFVTVLAALLTDDTLLFTLVTISGIAASAFYGAFTFHYAFAPAKQLEESGATTAGVVLCTTLAVMLAAQAIPAFSAQDPQQLTQWYTGLKLFGVFMAFVGLAAIGRFFLDPPEKKKLADITWPRE